MFSFIRNRLSEQVFERFVLRSLLCSLVPLGIGFAVFFLSIWFPDAAIIGAVTTTGSLSAMMVLVLLLTLQLRIWPDLSPKELSAYLQSWKNEYRAQVARNRLFDPGWTSTWSDPQKQLFVRLFYHARGHFGEFLWTLANMVDDYFQRKCVVSNIMDELGVEESNAPGTPYLTIKPHEKLFERFATAAGVDIKEEIRGKTYLPFLRRFNAGHLGWLATHHVYEGWAAFAAYELLDNVDYGNLLTLAQGLSVDGKALTFFEVHAKSDHFGDTYQYLLNAWRRDPENVRRGFEFIASHQLSMWCGIERQIAAVV